MEEEDLAEYFRLQYGERLLHLLQCVSEGPLHHPGLTFQSALSCSYNPVPQITLPHQPGTNSPPQSSCFSLRPRHQHGLSPSQHTITFAQTGDRIPFLPPGVSPRVTPSPSLPQVTMGPSCPCLEQEVPQH